MPAVGAAVRVWWPEDGCWREGRVLELRADAGEFLVDIAEDDEQAWASANQPWEPVGGAAAAMPPPPPPAASPVLAARAAAAAAAAAAMPPPPPPAAPAAPAAPAQAAPPPADATEEAQQRALRQQFDALHDEALRQHGHLAAPAELAAAFDALAQRCGVTN